MRTSVYLPRVVHMRNFMSQLVDVMGGFIRNIIMYRHVDKVAEVSTMNTYTAWIYPKVSRFANAGSEIIHT